MYPLNQALAFLASLAGLTPAMPERPLPAHTTARGRAFDIHAHRGGRGNTVENTLPAFAWGMVNGARTLELDNGITKDGVVVVWHDEEITSEKCSDTAPVTAGDPDWPYVGKFIANLTWAQLKTLDCGSKRPSSYPLQLTYPGTRISTLSELFDFVSCADPSRQMLFNIESKINAAFPNQTRSVYDFVTLQHEVFQASPYRSSITYQSFDWRTLISMKHLNPSMVTSALIELDTAVMPSGEPSPWLAGLKLEDFGGPEITTDVRIPRAAASVGADILSPAAGTGGNGHGVIEWVPFTTKAMVDEAHRLGVLVKPWTVNNLDVLEDHVEWGVDGTITDYPDVARRWALHRGLPVAPKYDEDHVMKCLNQALDAQRR